MEFTASQIAGILEGEVQGDPEIAVNTLSKIEEGKSGSLTFLANPKYTPFLYTTKASITIVNKDFVPEKDHTTTLIKVADAYQSFSKLLSYYDEVKNDKKGIEEPVFRHSTAKIGENLYMGAFSYIGENVILGDNVKIYPNAYIAENCIIGDNVVVLAGAKVCSDSIIGNNCVIHNGAIIGADGFGFSPNNDGTFDKIPQIGNVVLGDNVDVGAGTTIDRATMGSTVLHNGVKLDNQIQIAHNVEIGENTVIAAQSGIAGSAKIGKNCMIGGQVGIVGHLTVGNNVKIAAQSGIGSNLKDDVIVQGSPAFEVGNYRRSYVSFRRLPETLRTIEQQLKELMKG